MIGIEKVMEKKQEVSWILKGICIVLSILSLMGTLFLAIIGVAIAWGCASKCAELARKIKKDVNAAFAVGFFLSLIGLLIYWIYYKSKSKTWGTLTKGWGL